MTTTDARRPLHAIAVLLVVAAGLFVVGVTSENDNGTHNDEPTPETAAADGHDEATESAEAIEAEAEERSTSEAEHAEEEAEKDEEGVLGIDAESPVLVTAAVVMSLLLAGLVWRRPDRRLLIIIAIFGATFAVLDAAEVAHQLDEDNTALTLLAGAITALHAAAAALALHQATTTRAAREPVTS
jgi:hypothetical protein